jgi:hypothetical protein
MQGTCDLLSASIGASTTTARFAPPPSAHSEQFPSTCFNYIGILPPFEPIPALRIWPRLTSFFLIPAFASNACLSIAGAGEARESLARPGLNLVSTLGTTHLTLCCWNSKLSDEQEVLCTLCCRIIKIVILFLSLLSFPFNYMSSWTSSFFTRPHRVEKDSPEMTILLQNKEYQKCSLYTLFLRIRQIVASMKDKTIQKDQGTEYISFPNGRS